MIEKYDILNNGEYPRRGCIIALPGRGGDNDVMLQVCKHTALTNTMMVSLQPFGHAYYPPPNSPDDQDKAVKGMYDALPILLREINRIQQAWKFKRNEIVLMGFSAGAVMAIQTAVRSSTPFAAAISLSGSVLDPAGLPKCKSPKMPLLLQHNWDDVCFDWYERYVPMRDALEDKGYNISTMERFRGNHRITLNDVILVSEFLSKILGYPPDWTHPAIADGSEESQIGHLNKRLEIPDILFKDRDYILNRGKNSNDSNDDEDREEDEHNDEEE